MKRSRSCSNNQVEQSTSNLLNQDILKNVCCFLSLPDINAVSVTCTEWKTVVWENDDIWKELLIRRYSNLRSIEQGYLLKSCGGRDAYIHRICLHKCKMMPVRNFGSSLLMLPPPLQRKIPGETLMEKWKPELVVIFLLDIWKGPIQILSHSWTPKREDCRPGRSHGVVTDDRVRQLLDIRLDTHLLRGSKEMQAMDDTLREIQPGDFDCFSLPLHVQLSYVVKGCYVPVSDPVILLSEHVAFFSGAEGTSHKILNFRTDVEEGWNTKPDFDAHPHGYPEYSRDNAQKKYDLFHEHQARYGSYPLPFDPSVELLCSPIGQTCRYPDTFGGNDSNDVWSLHVEVEFSYEEDCRLDYSNTVLPCLLSMWNDADRCRKTNRRAQW